MIATSTVVSETEEVEKSFNVLHLQGLPEASWKGDAHSAPVQLI